MTRFKLIHMDTLSCEPIARRMPNGDLLTICQCGDVKEPAPLNRVYAFRSKDEGQTWSPKELVYPEDGQAVYNTEVMVLNDEVTLFLTLHNGYFDDWKCVMMKSYDSGYTWVNAGPPPYLDSYTFVRGQITLKNGAILIPYQQYPLTREQREWLKINKTYVWKSGVKTVRAGVIISYDGGKTFEKGGAIDISLERGWIWPEPTIVELSNGAITMLLRMDGAGYLYRSDSFDGGKSWTEPIKTDIPNPNNKVKLLKFNDGRIALLHTPNSSLQGLRSRNPLSVWISNDDLKSWYYKKDLTDFDGCFSYPDGFITSDQKHIMFTVDFNRHDIYFVDHEIEE
ncbi:MAG TPA: sialidase family protein [Clostridia bacterium]|jgi:hypothetical protein